MKRRRGGRAEDGSGREGVWLFPLHPALHPTPSASALERTLWTLHSQSLIHQTHLYSLQFTLLSLSLNPFTFSSSSPLSFSLSSPSLTSTPLISSSFAPDWPMCKGVWKSVSRDGRRLFQINVFCGILGVLLTMDRFLLPNSCAVSISVLFLSLHPELI